ncbi:MAG: DUF814 domain-containing protein [bacterium]|nr:DUF814 domain-containing protein [bacterium]
MRITLDLKKSVEENAANYFEKAKKAKKKVKGAREAIEKSRKKLLNVKKVVEEEEKKAEKKKVPKEWFEKFRWFICSDGFLVVGGRDATTNEIVIKKHTDKEDVVFHTDMAGSPFFVIKSGGKKVSEKSLEEVAKATASYSRAWRLGLGYIEVFHVKPEQVTKKAQSGEYMAKGAFMVYGKTNYITAEVGVAVGISKDKIMGGPESAIKKNCEKYVKIKQGKDKASDVAKKIKRKIGGELDDIIRNLPSGGCAVEK